MQEQNSSTIYKIDDENLFWKTLKLIWIILQTLILIQILENNTRIIFWNKDNFF